MTWSSIISRRFQKWLKLCFRKLGIKIYYHPYAFMSSGLLLTFACCLGFLNFSYENRSMYLWIPNTSQFFLNFETYINYFGEFESNMLLIIKENTGNNILTTDTMNILYNIFLESTNNSKLAIKSANVDWYFQDLCTRQYDSYPVCDSIESNIFSFWQNNPNYWSNQDLIKLQLDTYQIPILVKCATSFDTHIIDSNIFLLAGLLLHLFR